MTVHAYTATQNLIDGPVKGRDLRRGRAAAANIVPSTTGAATAVARAIPALQGRFDGVSMRAFVLTGSISAIVFVSSRRTSAEEINGVLETAARTERWSRVLDVTHDPIVSSDIVGDSHAAIVDLSLTKVVDGDFARSTAGMTTRRDTPIRSSSTWSKPSVLVPGAAARPNWTAAATIGNRYLPTLLGHPQELKLPVPFKDLDWEGWTHPVQ